MEKENRKINLAINQDQIDIFTNFMGQHQELTTNKLNTINARQKAKSLWKKLSDNLNAAGPPTKETSEWKKVWADYKYKAKNKLQFNAIQRKKTGGGPCNEKKLNSFEESIVSLCGLEAQIKGIEGTKSFGAGQSNSCELQQKVSASENCILDDSDDIIQASVREILGESDELDDECNNNNIPNRKSENIEASEGNCTPLIQENTRRRKNLRKEEKADLFVKYVRAVEENSKIQNDILEILRRNYTLTERNYELGEKIYKLKEKNNRLREKVYYLKKKAVENKDKQSIEKNRLKKLLLEAKLEEIRLRQQQM